MNHSLLILYQMFELPGQLCFKQLVLGFVASSVYRLFLLSRCQRRGRLKLNCLVFGVNWHTSPTLMFFNLMFEQAILSSLVNLHNLLINQFFSLTKSNPAHCSSVKKQSLTSGRCFRAVKVAVIGCSKTETNDYLNLNTTIHCLSFHCLRCIYCRSPVTAGSSTWAQIKSNCLTSTNVSRKIKWKADLWEHALTKVVF